LQMREPLKPNWIKHTLQSFWLYAIGALPEHATSSVPFDRAYFSIGFAYMISGFLSVWGMLNFWKQKRRQELLLFSLPILVAGFLTMMSKQNIYARNLFFVQGFIYLLIAMGLTHLIPSTVERIRRVNTYVAASVLIILFVFFFTHINGNLEVEDTQRKEEIKETVQYIKNIWTPKTKFFFDAPYDESHVIRRFYMEQELTKEEERLSDPDVFVSIEDIDGIRYAGKFAGYKQLAKFGHYIVCSWPHPSKNLADK